MKIKEIDILEYLVIVFISLFVFTPFEKYRIMLFIVPIFIIILLIMIYIDHKFIVKNIVIFLIIIFMLLLDVLLSYSTQNVIYIRYYITHKLFVYFWLLLFCFFITRKKYLKNIVNIILIMFFISSIYTIYGNILYPEASRLLASNQEIFKTKLELYRALNIGGYDFIYACTFLILPLLNYIKLTKSKMYCLFVIIEIITILVGAYTIGIILAFYSVLFSFIRVKNLKKGILVIIIVSILVFFLKEILLGILSNIGEMVKADIIVKRAQELLFGTYISDYEGSRSRIQLYTNALINIKNNLIGGLILNTEGLLNSGHSNFLQYFEFYGIFGIIYIVFFILWYKVVNKNLYDKKIKVQFKFYFLLVLIFIFLDTIDSSYSVGIICFFIGPGLFVLSNRNVKNVKKGDGFIERKNIFY